MLIRFTKMHGLGNDFMVVDLITQRARFTPERVRKLADRNFGIGFDQLLLVEAPTDPEMAPKLKIAVTVPVALLALSPANALAESIRLPYKPPKARSI